MSVGVLASGILGSNLLWHLSVVYDVVFVMTDKNSQAIIDFCEEKKISLFIGNPRSGKSDCFIEGKDIEILISVNYLFLIENNLIRLPKKYAINIHGSLLPKYRGRTPHVWAIINNEKETGISAHVIEEGCDTGPIIKQVKVQIESHDTGGDILEKFRKLYFPIVDSVLQEALNDNLQFKAQDHSKATYFGKRTPDDGEINWCWQKERIYNWIRAQTYPYPGAFTYYKNEKIVIDQIELTDDGYNNDMSNGEVLSIEPFKIKSPNGVILIKKTRNTALNIQVGAVLK